MFPPPLAAREGINWLLVAVWHGWHHKTLWLAAAALLPLVLLLAQIPLLGPVLATLLMPWAKAAAVVAVALIRQRLPLSVAAVSSALARLRPAAGSMVLLALFESLSGSALILSLGVWTDPEPWMWLLGALWLAAVLVLESALNLAPGLVWQGQKAWPALLSALRWVVHNWRAWAMFWLGVMAVSLLLLSPILLSTTEQTLNLSELGVISLILITLTLIPMLLVADAIAFWAMSQTTQKQAETGG